MRRNLLLFFALMFTMVVGILAGELAKAITGTSWSFFLGPVIVIPLWLALHNLITRRRA